MDLQKFYRCLVYTICQFHDLGSNRQFLVPLDFVLTWTFFEYSNRRRLLKFIALTNSRFHRNCSLFSQTSVGPHVRSLLEACSSPSVPSLICNQPILPQPGGQLIHVLTAHPKDTTWLSLSASGKLAATCEWFGNSEISFFYLAFTCILLKKGKIQ